MDNIEIMHVIAYYLSEYDMEAVKTLGYSSCAEAFREIGRHFRKNNNYLKRLRDEYDVVTSSSRRGQCNRPTRKKISITAENWKVFSFEELTGIINSLMGRSNALVDESAITEIVIDEYSEVDIESVINAKDPSATIRYRNNATNATRFYDHSIISNLKKLYRNKCQICGDYPIDGVYTDICEAHHIEYFSKSMNNDASNILIVCPNHHRLIHKLNPVYCKEDTKYIFSDGMEMKIKLNYRLK